MKKIKLFIVVLFLTASVFATQEAFGVSDYEYQQTLALCRAAGIETVQLVSPVSSDQLLKFLNTIPEGRLSENENRILKSLVEHLEHPYMVYGKEDYGFDAIITACPDVFVHTADEEVLLNESVETRREILPVLMVGGKVYFSKYGYGTFTFSNGINEIDRKSHFSTNMNLAGFNVEISSPYQAYVSLGTGALNFIIGRDRLSLGKGKTGNLLLGDNFLFEDFAKVSYFNKLFSYDMTLITFDVNDDYDETTETYDSPLHLGVFDFNSAHQMVVTHQFSFKPFKWFNFSVTEGMLQYGNNLFGDLSIISPFMLLHDINSYTEGNANNFFSADLSFALGKGWEINASLFFDQIQQIQELTNGKPTEETRPNAHAFLLNAVYSREVAGGMADFYVEGVYTNPAVYLKDLKGSYNGGAYNHYDVDLVVGNNLLNAEVSDINYLGYKYGPDTIAVATGFNYSYRDKLQLTFESLFKIHGEKGIQWYFRQNQQDYNDVGIKAFYEVSPTGIPEYRLSFVSTAKYSPTNWITLNTEIGYIRAWNYHNRTGVDFRDFQLALGVKLNPVHLVRGFIL